MEHKFAVIQVWRKGAGYENRSREKRQRNFLLEAEHYEQVIFFEEEKEAKRFYKDLPQGQTAKDGEVRRFFVEIKEKW